MKTFIIFCAALYLVEATSYSRDDRSRRSPVRVDDYETKNPIDYNRYHMEKMEEITNLIRDISSTLKQMLTYYKTATPTENAEVNNDSNVIPEETNDVTETSESTGLDINSRRCYLAIVECCVEEDLERVMCFNDMSCPGEFTYIDYACQIAGKDFNMDVFYRIAQNLTLLIASPTVESGYK